MAYVQKMSYTRGSRTATSNVCPLCSLKDSGSNLLGVCRHQDMVNSYIEQHNEAGRSVHTAITKGINVFIAGLDTKQIMQAIGASDARLPARPAQETDPSEQFEDGEARESTDGSRPG